LQNSYNAITKYTLYLKNQLQITITTNRFVTNYDIKFNLNKYFIDANLTIHSLYSSTLRQEG
jgi:hypothetical protein